VQNSDAHTLADFAASPAKRTLTRIKMNDLTFDGFRTAFADPEARIRAAAELPRSVPRIIGMHVSGGFLREEKYHFSDNLNCFIGGRGTGKSTAIRCIAHALGVDDSLESYDNCPDSVVVYCRDASGVSYRYERMRGSAPQVRAKDDNTIADVPVDAFRIEFYGQGTLADVARDPLAHPRLFQEFLDRNTILSDLFSREGELLADLESNGAQLRPLELLAATRPKKKTELDEVAAKLRVAEEGKLKELVAAQTRVGAEKALAKAYGDVRDSYARGLTLESVTRNTKAIEDTAGARSLAQDVEARVDRLRGSVEAANQYARSEQTAINLKLRELSVQMTAELGALAKIHSAKDAELAIQVAGFQKAGLSASVADLQRHVNRHGQLTGELTRIDQAAAQLAALREARATLLTALLGVRASITDRRKNLVRDLNRHLSSAIDDYTVALKLEPEGIADDFVAFVAAEMRGTYFQDDAARRMCARLSPRQLADYVVAGDHAGLAAAAGMTAEWAEKVCVQLLSLEKVHRLEVIWKTPRPEILVVPKLAASKPIPVNQLSDGQRHTIFLTIAMLAESDAPLIIDQPEDDLDNAFVFSSVVETLRLVKECRQVIVVTHNANIAVLGDAEMIFPMRRTDDRGVALDRGAIDRKETRNEVQRILEGGEEAFRRRKEIYGY
jgi:hypothetical protein